jgi:anthranilate phosphoribosyltransferase
MSYAHIIKEIGRGAEGSRDMSLDEAQQLYGAMLDGGVPDLELGAILVALRMKGESNDEMIGFLTAANERVNALQAPHSSPRPVVIPTYNGARKGANLTPLLAMLLQRFGVPVVVHGLLEGYGRVTTGHVFRELGIMPVASQIQAQQSLSEQGLVFAPLQVIAPGLTTLLALRARLGIRNSAHSKLVMVGNGMAGVRTLEELLKLAPDLYDITVFGAEPHPNYNRILLSPVLAGEMTIRTSSSTI